MYPAGWDIQVPALSVNLRIEPDLDDQELYALRSINRSYWEGSVSVSGQAGGKPVGGKGYVELVGYGQDLKQELPGKKVSARND